MSNDPCLDAAYAEWGTQNLSAAQRKRLHRTSTVGGGTPNKATLALATQPGSPDDELWMEAASIADAAERAHLQETAAKKKLNGRNRKRRDGASTRRQNPKQPKKPKQQKTNRQNQQEQPAAQTQPANTQNQNHQEQPAAQTQLANNQNQQEQASVQTQLAQMPAQTRAQTITLAGKSITIEDDSQAQFLLQAAEEYKRRQRVEANKMRAQRIQTLKKELSRLKVEGAGLHQQLMMNDCSTQKCELELRELTMELNAQQQ